jgi:hypothetical protein
MKNWIIVELAEWEPIRDDTRILLNFIEQLKSTGHKDLAIMVDSCLDVIDFDAFDTGEQEKLALSKFMFLVHYTKMGMPRKRHIKRKRMYLTHNNRRIVRYQAELVEPYVRWDFNERQSLYQRGDILLKTNLHVETT